MQGLIDERGCDPESDQVATDPQGAVAAFDVVGDESVGKPGIVDEAFRHKFGDDVFYLRIGKARRREPDRQLRRRQVAPRERSGRRAADGAEIPGVFG